MYGTRPKADVDELLQRAIRFGFAKNPSHAFDKCARLVLTPLFATQRIRDIQKKLGVKVQA